ncbi:MAG: hypothetical protein EOM26_10905 [Alphaproteobacteria bacterium]|nr:hypothetical protein [Alphaproteobacteria bacterium]
MVLPFAIYLVTASVFYTVGVMTSAQKDLCQPCAIAAAVLWPLSLAAVGGYVLFEKLTSNRPL